MMLCRCDIISMRRHVLQHRSWTYGFSKHPMTCSHALATHVRSASSHSDDKVPIIRVRSSMGATATQ